MAYEFIRAMYQHVPEESKILLCQFRGDPNDDIKGKWRAKPLMRPSQIDEHANVYLTVSAMKRNERGEYRRRKENFSAGLLLMIDDLGTGPGSKFPLSTIDGLPPTALIETSPDNFQAVYMFDEPITDMSLFQRLIQSFIQEQFLGSDTGMAGVNRVFRPPHGVNAKGKYRSDTGPWRVRLTEWREEARYGVQDLVRYFRLDLSAPERRMPRGATSDKAESIRRFVQVRQSLRAAGMLKSEESDMAGWTDIVCPWTGDHTGGVDNGAAIREPHEDNGWVGAFRCHHASCEGKGWREMTEWLADEQHELLELINSNEKGFHYYHDGSRT